MMDTNLKFSLITTIIALGVIVAFSLTAIIINSAKIFCHFVHFCFFVIDVMLLTSDVTPSSLTV